MLAAAAAAIDNEDQLKSQGTLAFFAFYLVRLCLHKQTAKNNRKCETPDSEWSSQAQVARIPGLFSIRRT